MIDASGTWRQPNPAGADGLPGARRARGGKPDPVPGPGLRAPSRSRASTPSWSASAFRGDSGHRAGSHRRGLSWTVATWVLRRGEPQGRTFGGGAADQLPARGASWHPCEAGRGSRTGRPGDRVPHRADPPDVAGRAVLVSEDGRGLTPADAVVVLTGFRRTCRFLSEVRLDLDPVLQAPAQDRAFDHRMSILRHRRPDARAGPGTSGAGPVPGWDEVLRAGADVPGDELGTSRCAVSPAELAGDHEAAARTELMLPDTGVCGGAGLFDDPDGASGGRVPAPQLLEIGQPPHAPEMTMPAPSRTRRSRFPAAGARRAVRDGDRQLRGDLLRLPGAGKPDRGGTGWSRTAVTAAYSAGKPGRSRRPGRADPARVRPAAGDDRGACRGPVGRRDRGRLVVRRFLAAWLAAGTASVADRLSAALTGCTGRGYRH